MERGQTRSGQVDVPVDLRNALASEPSAQEAWRQLPAHDQQAHVADLESAADPMARERCVRELVNDLAVQTAPRKGR